MLKSIYPHQKPPRHLSLYSQAVLLCSGIYATIGWILLGFGMIFFWTFTYNSSAMLWFSPSVDWENGQGTIVKIEDTNTSENDENIYQIRYTYFVYGKEYGGKGYVLDHYYMEGDGVDIQFNPDEAAQSKLKHGRQQMFSAWAAFIFIFPLTGLILLFFGTKENYKALKLLKNGIFSTGKMLSKEPTGGYVTLNNVEYPICKYEFQFSVKGKEWISKFKTYDGHAIEDEVEEFILYDHRHPDINIVYDAIFNAPGFDSSGRIKQIPSSKFYFLIAPLLTLGIHLPWAFFLLA